MNPAPRGPDGAAPPPPAWLNDRPLPITEVDLGAVLFRVHPLDFGPVFFGPGSGQAPVFRFDPASMSFGVLYVGLSSDAALIETLLRNPARLILDHAVIEARALSRLQAPRRLRLVRAHGDGLSLLGTTAAISTGPYGPCAAWSDALHDHPDAPDGILYASRHDSDLLCAALFDKASPGLTVADTTPLTVLLHLIGALLDRYGKSLIGL